MWLQSDSWEQDFSTLITQSDPPQGLERKKCSGTCTSHLSLSQEDPKFETRLGNLLTYQDPVAKFKKINGRGI